MIMRLQITVELLYSFSRGARCTDIGSKLMKGCLVGLPSNQITIAAKSEHRVPLFAQLDWQTVSANNRDVLGSRSTFADSNRQRI